MINNKVKNKATNKDKTKPKYKNFKDNMKSQIKFMKASYQNLYNSIQEQLVLIQEISDQKDKVYKQQDKMKNKMIKIKKRNNQRYIYYDIQKNKGKKKSRKGS